MSTLLCAQSDLNARWSADNVNTWATLAAGDGAAEITTRCNLAIAIASDELLEVLRAITSYESKLGNLTSSTIPDSAQDKVVIRAGIWLYSPRATDDYGDLPGWMQWLYKQYEEWLDDLREGKRKLNIT